MSRRSRAAGGSERSAAARDLIPRGHDTLDVEPLFVLETEPAPHAPGATRQVARIPDRAVGERLPVESLPVSPSGAIALPRRRLTPSGSSSAGVRRSERRGQV